MKRLNAEMQDLLIEADSNILERISAGKVVILKDRDDHLSTDQDSYSHHEHQPRGNGSHLRNPTRSQIRWYRNRIVVYQYKMELEVQLKSSICSQAPQMIYTISSQA